MQLNHLSAAGAVLVTDIVAGSPAYRAGMRVRDIIIAIGGSVVSGVDDLQRLLTRDHIDRDTAVTVLRDGGQLELRVYSDGKRLELHSR